MGRTFLVAALTLGGIGMAQFAAVGVAFYRSVEEDERSAPTKIDIEKLMAESPPPKDEPLSVENPLDENPGFDASGRPRPIMIAANVDGAPPPAEPAPPTPDKAEPAPSAPGVPPRPTPVPLSALTPKVDPRLTELVEQGKLLRTNGDTAGALVKLREAGAISPEDPLPIAEMAYTYEKMSLPDKAAAEWRRILQMGDRAGFYFSAAKSKLDIAVTTARAAVGGPTGGAGEGEVRFANGRAMALGRVTMAEEAGGKGKRFTLSIPIHAKQGAVTNPRTEVVTQVRFFDQINAKDIVPTTANVAYRFTDPPADWEDGGIETLQVDYDQPLVGRDDPAGEGRRYHGYVVRIYFKGQLQAVFAEPANLVQKFPAPEKNP